MSNVELRMMNEEVDSCANSNGASEGTLYLVLSTLYKCLLLDTSYLILTDLLTAGRILQIALQFFQIINRIQVEHFQPALLGFIYAPEIRNWGGQSIM